MAKVALPLSDVKKACKMPLRETITEASINGPIEYSIVFEIGGKTYETRQRDYDDRALYWKSATSELFAMTPKNVLCVEVRPIEKTITVYEEVD